MNALEKHVYELDKLLESKYGKTEKEIKHKAAAINGTFFSLQKDKAGRTKGMRDKIATLEVRCQSLE